MFDDTDFCKSSELFFLYSLRNRRENLPLQRKKAKSVTVVQRIDLGLRRKSPRKAKRKRIKKNLVRGNIMTLRWAVHLNEAATTDTYNCSG